MDATSNNSIGNDSLQSILKVPFHTEKDAEIAWNTLKVDREPPRGGCKRQLKVDGYSLEVCLTADDPKKLRVGLNSFMDSLLLVIETLKQFGPAVDT